MPKRARHGEELNQIFSSYMVRHKKEVPVRVKQAPDDLSLTIGKSLGKIRYLRYGSLRYKILFQRFSNVDGEPSFQS